MAHAGVEEAAKAHKAGDYKTAFNEYLAAAQKGIPEAQGWTGLLYYRGQGVSRNYKEALNWFQQAAAKGDGRGTNGMGILYQNGKAVPKNHEEAVKWYRRAADKGYPSAYTNIGYMYSQGDGLPKDDVKAAKWYKQGAEMGHGMGQCNLGLVYVQGKGIEKDLVKAYMWFYLSDEAGFAKANKWKNKAKKKLTNHRSLKPRRWPRRGRADAETRRSNWEAKPLDTEKGRHGDTGRGCEVSMGAWELEGMGESSLSFRAERPVTAKNCI